MAIQDLIRRREEQVIHSVPSHRFKRVENRIDIRPSQCVRAVTGHRINSQRHNGVGGCESRERSIVPDVKLSL